MVLRDVTVEVIEQRRGLLWVEFQDALGEATAGGVNLRRSRLHNAGEDPTLY
jgi:hypothetical protein